MKLPTVHIKNIEAREIRGSRTATLPFGAIPVLIDGLAGEWPAARRWTQRGLQERFPDQEISCFTVSPRERSFLQQVNATRSMALEAFLEHIFSEDEPQDLLYLRIGSSDPLFQDLKEDFSIPDLLPGYNPSATGIWMGQRGNLTPFHHDWWHSFLAQISGRKSYLIVSPLEMPALQETWPLEARYDFAPAPYISPDDERVKRLESCFSGTLEAGQTLYIPPYWFHQIETLDNGNISIPIRFDSAQSPDLPLFQFGQRSCLRDVTNRQMSDELLLAERLKENRRLFQEREREFVGAFLKARGSDRSCEEILASLEAPAADVS